MTIPVTKQPPLLEDLRNHSQEQVAELRDLLNALGEFEPRQTAHAPRVCQKGGRDSEAHDIREGIKLNAELCVCSGQSCYAAIERVENDRQPYRFRRVIE